MSDSILAFVGRGYDLDSVAYSPFFAVLLVWSIFWKGLALWHSAGRKQGIWFIVLLLVNTAGILEIVYLFAFLKLKFENLFSHSGETK